MQNNENALTERSLPTPHLYSNYASDAIHIIQSANKLADDSVESRAEPSAGNNGSVHLIRLEIHPLTWPGTSEVGAPRTSLMNNNLQTVMLQGLAPSKITLHTVQFIACQRGKKVTFCVTVSSVLTKYCLRSYTVQRKVSFGTSVCGWRRT
jgi:hypothetical protein